METDIGPEIGAKGSLYLTPSKVLDEVKFGTVKNMIKIAITILKGFGQNEREISLSAEHIRGSKPSLFISDALTNPVKSPSPPSSSAHFPPPRFIGGGEGGEFGSCIMMFFWLHEVEAGSD